MPHATTNTNTNTHTWKSAVDGNMVVQRLFSGGPGGRGPLLRGSGSPEARMPFVSCLVSAGTRPEAGRATRRRKVRESEYTLLCGPQCGEGHKEVARCPRHPPGPSSACFAVPGKPRSGGTKMRAKKSVTTKKQIVLQAGLVNPKAFKGAVAHFTP